ncbi:hypothetical protein C8F04DRAFT_1191386 [Mycena alexandri]|uniref:Uncharacterized protein n=1 Tax=Mycena alexandri TaxID=1745969 RepID=A0AAD6WSH7_9AGAR|nr:hypothetical protein C8F04DRAFT_1191386 [Mycena alexandri]
MSRQGTYYLLPCNLRTPYDGGHSKAACAGMHREDTKVTGRCEMAARARMTERRMIMSQLAERRAFAAYFKSTLPYCTEEDAFKLIEYFKELLALIDRLREFGELGGSLITSLRSRRLDLLHEPRLPRAIERFSKRAVLPDPLADHLVETRVKNFAIPHQNPAEEQSRSSTRASFASVEGRTGAKPRSPRAVVRVARYLVPAEKTRTSIAASPQAMSDAQTDSEEGWVSSGEKSADNALMSSPIENAPPKAPVTLTQAEQELRCVERRAHIRRLLDQSRADAAVAAHLQDRLRMESETRAAALYTQALRREFVSSQEYQDYVERRHQRRVAAKDAEAAAWRHAFAVARLQGVGVSGAPGTVLRKKRRPGESHPECAARFAQRLKEAKLELARKASLRDGVGAAAAPGAALRKSKKKRPIFSPNLIGGDSTPALT